jgi:hypothetical protein
MIPQYTPISRLAAFRLVTKILKLLSMDSLCTASLMMTQAALPSTATRLMTIRATW